MRNIDAGYRRFADDIARLLVEARRQAARSINIILTATYWENGRRIIEFEQGGQKRAGYGENLLKRLSADLTRRFGRGFSNVSGIRRRRLRNCLVKIAQTLPGKLASGAVE